jgi:hypothetical protein
MGKNRNSAHLRVRSFFEGRFLREEEDPEPSVDERFGLERFSLRIAMSSS